MASGRRTVLVADDDARARDICRTTLLHAGYQVVEAVDGKEALAVARQHLPDLIILDLKMPRMDGWQALEHMRADPLLTGAIIVTLTIVGPGEDRRDPVRRGFDAHYTKPVSPARLVEMVRGWIGPPTTVGATPADTADDEPAGGVPATPRPADPGEPPAPPPTDPAVGTPDTDLDPV